MELPVRFLFICLLLGVLVAPAVAMPGGRTEADPEDAENQKAAKFAIETLNTESATRGEFGEVTGKITLLSLKRVATQVVAGTAFHMLLSAKDEAGRIFDIKAIVWSRPWLENRDDVDEPAWQLTGATMVNGSDHREM